MVWFLKKWGEEKFLTEENVHMKVPQRDNEVYHPQQNLTTHTHTHTCKIHALSPHTFWYTTRQWSIPSTTKPYHRHTKIHALSPPTFWYTTRSSIPSTTKPYHTHRHTHNNKNSMHFHPTHSGTTDPPPPPFIYLCNHSTPHPHPNLIFQCKWTLHQKLPLSWDHFHPVGT